MGPGVRKRGSEIKKGYEIEKDNYIVFEKKELNRIKLKTTHSIDIKEFIEYKELDPILIDNSYYVTIDSKKDNEKTYALLVKILNENNLVAIGKVVPKGGKTYQGRENLQGSLEALKASIETKGSSTQKKPHVHSLSLIYVVTN